MIRTIAVAAALFATAASAQDLASYNKALSAYNNGSFEDAARLFYDVTNTTTDAEMRLKSEYYLASSFHKLNLPFTAFVYYSVIVKAGPQHPYHLKAVEGLVAVQDQLEDENLIPSLLNKLYDKYADAWATLPLEVLSRINFLIGRMSHRRGKLEEARQFFEAVPSESPMYAKAQYMIGVTLADPRFPAATEDEKRKNVEKGIDVFQSVLGLKTRQQKELVETQQLATLALGRAYYNLGEYQRSVEWYEKIPRFSKYWDAALFENGFARFQNDDFGGGLGSLQALHAPQFTGAFQPESWVLKSTIYYFSCLYEESKSALAEFENLYLPMADKLRPLVEGEQKDNTAYFKMVDTTESAEIPRPVLNWVRANDAMLHVFALLKQIDAEKAYLDNNQSWKAAKLSGEVVTYLDTNRGTLEQVAGNFAKRRVVEAYRTIKGFADNAEIIRFEVAKAEKELAETGVDQQAVLRKQTIYRPKMPQENWNYWKFQGEFWRDEIGYYQYTLKKGCPGQ